MSAEIDQPVDRSNPGNLKTISGTVYHCEFADGQFCTFKGKGTPSKRSTPFMGRAFCHQGASSDKSKITCSEAKITEEVVQAYVSKSGMLS